MLKNFPCWFPDFVSLVVQRQTKQQEHAAPKTITNWFYF